MKRNSKMTEAEIARLHKLFDEAIREEETSPFYGILSMVNLMKSVACAAMSKSRKIGK